jgi:hypothetical protein
MWFSFGAFRCTRCSVFRTTEYFVCICLRREREVWDWDRLATQLQGSEVKSAAREQAAPRRVKVS